MVFAIRLNDLFTVKKKKKVHYFPSEAMSEQGRTGCGSESVKTIPGASTILDKKNRRDWDHQMSFLHKGLIPEGETGSWR